MYSSGQITNCFKERFSASESSKGWYVFDCPRCGKKNKAAVHPEFGCVKCWVCDYKESVYEFLKTELNGEPSEYMQTFSKHVDEFKRGSGRSRTLTHEMRIQLPQDFKLITENTQSIGKRACKYLTSRNLDLDYLEMLGFGYVDREHEDENYFGYLIVPFISAGKLIYYLGRNFMGGLMRYKNPPAEKFGVGKSTVIWNEDALRTEDKIYVMEGVFSALTLKDFGVAVLGKSPSTHQVSKLIKSNASEIVLCFDPDAYDNSVKLAHSLLPYKRVKVLRLRGGDPNDLGEDAIKELESYTPYLSWSNIWESI